MVLKSGRGVNLIQGELITLLASAAQGVTLGTNGTAVYVGGERHRLGVLLNVTAAASEITDLLDVYVDVSPDNAKWMNAIRFTRVLGNGGAVSFFAVLDPSNPPATVTDTTTDALAGVVRPSLFGAYYRARWVLFDGGGAAAGFTFAVTMWAE
jgi:hypothetical protein